ncbi:hypothetical protein NAEGRDRAFT_79264 [Naegleria gruberi]|uniref:Uncharacterized protein n=1 Tax=Naegleria gruberi TaxID=5762 RepID=D2VB16_NAEGR|nr:uncharacterized protein NAEGRDRAFT_79264 [Naegleria gruberi]EFC46043.1 hypothetical protein NAEGRDRAFT_79264 [Naegleria gruberi]|eukprot:XP_002678787.1 hypothetical protein NAEGRDRAFT_79264 [Naegleria gruberi strain NEG-M]
MARTKQTKRKTCPNTEEERIEKIKQRKILLGQENHSWKRTSPSFILYPTDISIRCTITNSETDPNSNQLLLLLGNKFVEHVCSDSTCHCDLPRINWQKTGFYTQFFSDVLVNPRNDYTFLGDGEASEEYSERAMNILEKVLNNVQAYEMNTKLIECERKKESINSITIEYSTCGSKCYYKSNCDYEYEFVVLLVSEDEHLAFGHIGCHAFYLLPGLEYLNSDGSSPNVCSDSIITYDEENDMYHPNIIPLSKVLKKSKEFLRNVLDDRYH